MPTGALIRKIDRQSSPACQKRAPSEGSGRLLRMIIALLFSCGLAMLLHAQEIAPEPVSTPLFQFAISSGSAGQAPGSGATPQSSASIAGTAKNGLGAAVSGAQVTLVTQENTVASETTTDSEDI
jgi:hypothetical protein